MSLIKGLEISINRHLEDIENFGKIIKRLRKGIEDNPNFRKVNESQIRIFTAKCKSRNKAIREIRLYIEEQNGKRKD